MVFPFHTLFLIIFYALVCIILFLLLFFQGSNLRLVIVKYEQVFIGKITAGKKAIRVVYEIRTLFVITLKKSQKNSSLQSCSGCV